VTVKRSFAPRQLIGENRPTLWMAPLLGVVTLFYLYPAIEVLRFSFTDSNLLQANYEYTLRTYARVLTDPVLYKVIRTTAIFVGASVVFQLGLGLLIAVAANRARRRRLPGMVLMRSIILSAWVMPGVVIGIVWAILLNEASYGLANLVLSTFGLGPVAWLSTPRNALISIIIANVWRGTAFSMILQYAGLQSIPDELYEAAKVDGAGPWARLWHITIPMLRPTTLFLAVIGIIFAFQQFTQIFVMTRGGPVDKTTTMLFYIYQSAFQFFEMGYASTLAFTLFLMLLVFSVLQMRLYRQQT
jgi:multiple sugar transport system permease protein